MPLPAAHFLAGAAAAELFRSRARRASRDPGGPGDRLESDNRRGPGEPRHFGSPSRPGEPRGSDGQPGSRGPERSARHHRPWRVWLFGGMLGVLPDMDTGIGILLGRGNDFHGVYTHTLLAVLLVGAMVAWLWGRRWALIAAAAYSSHLVIDLFEVRRRTSVAPAWPLSSRTIETVRPIIPNVPYQRGSGPDGAALSLFDPAVFPAFLTQTVYAAVLLVLAIGVRALWTGWGRSGKPGRVPPQRGEQEREEQRREEQRREALRRERRA